MSKKEGEAIGALFFLFDGSLADRARMLNCGCRIRCVACLLAQATERLSPSLIGRIDRARSCCPDTDREPCYTAEVIAT